MGRKQLKDFSDTTVANIVVDSKSHRVEASRKESFTESELEGARGQKDEEINRLTPRRK